ncbi:hypothetical protein NITMOv2_0226 [Nitrospira moscoviensis]|uniref:Uncharacterized protein n=1 Tax=Nitrospira moscoviensis TaxID=42253 RepID=A0A0K2G6V9_NITMO|nr:hypothetical protein NITMOv2_0226 [Nitrospira moscoviensis]
MPGGLGLLQAGCCAQEPYKTADRFRRYYRSHHSEKRTECNQTGSIRGALRLSATTILEKARCRATLAAE